MELIDPRSIKWLTPLIQTTPKIPRNISSTRFEIDFDPNMVSEIELNQYEWQKFDNYQKKSKWKFDCFGPQLKLLETVCCGAMKTTSKMIFECHKIGTVKNI